MFDNFKTADTLIILSTLLGPIFAVQIQKYLERIRQKDETLRKIFTILMVTRGSKMSIDHVNALNSVPIEFYGKKKELTEICESWRKYINHLNSDYNVFNDWINKTNELYNEMLSKMAIFLKYDLSYTQITKEQYSPKGYQDLEFEQTLLRRNLIQILTGENKIKVEFHTPNNNRDSQGAEAP
jgi:hypothetical protein